MNFQHSYPKVTYKILKRLFFLLLDGEKEVKVIPRLSATLELGDKLSAELLKGADGIRREPGVQRLGGIFESGWKGFVHQGIKYLL